MVHTSFFSLIWTPLQFILKLPRPAVPVLRERFYVSVLKMEAETEGKDLPEKNIHFSRETVGHLLLGRFKAAITLVQQGAVHLYLYIYTYIQTNK